MVKITDSFREFLKPDEQLSALKKFIDNFRGSKFIKDITYIRTSETEMTFRIAIVPPAPRNYVETNGVDINVNLKEGEVNFIRFVKGSITVHVEDKVILKLKEDINFVVTSLIALAGNDLVLSLHLR